MDAAEAKLRFAGVLTKECPECKTPPGELCDTLGVWVHLERIKQHEDSQPKRPFGGIPWGEDLIQDCAQMQGLEAIGIFPGGYHYQNCSLH